MTQDTPLSSPAQVERESSREVIEPLLEIARKARGATTSKPASWHTFVKTFPPAVVLSLLSRLQAREEEIAADKAEIHSLTEEVAMEAIDAERLRALVSRLRGALERIETDETIGQHTMRVIARQALSLTLDGGGLGSSVDETAAQGTAALSPDSSETSGKEEQ